GWRTRPEAELGCGIATPAKENPRHSQSTPMPLSGIDCYPIVVRPNAHWRKLIGPWIRITEAQLPFGVFAPTIECVIYEQRACEIAFGANGHCWPRKLDAQRIEHIVDAR